jgi:hypothetical protein
MLLLAVAPWLGAARIDAVQLLVSGVCLAAAAAMARFGWPRVYQLRMRWHDGDGNASRNASSGIENPRWILDTEDEPDSPRGAYTVRLELEGAERWTVVRSPDPGAVLRQLRTLLAHCPAPVDCRWGIPEAASPWSFEPHPEATESEQVPSRAVICAPRCDPGLFWIMAIMALLMLLDLAFLVVSETEKVPVIHPLSVLLPILLAGCLSTIALALATGRTCLRITTHVSEEECVLGVRRRRGQVRVGSVREVHIVGAAGSTYWHLLVDSADGPLAMSVERGQAEALARHTRLAIADARAQSRTSSA